MIFRSSFVPRGAMMTCALVMKLFRVSILSIACVNAFEITKTGLYPTVVRLFNAIKRFFARGFPFGDR